MGSWSAENATKAYLKTLKMGHKANEPDEVEFISALAAGSNAQLMVVACAGAADATALALVAAAHQTGGRVVCILRGNDELDQSEELILGLDHACHVEFVIGDAQHLLLTHYREADFVLVDCDLESQQEGILRTVQMAAVVNKKRQNGVVFVGYNAFRKGSSSWRSNSSSSNNNITGCRTQLLPIGEGLLVTRINGSTNIGKVSSGTVNGKNTNTTAHRRSHSWVVKVDKCTGEEHVFRVKSPNHGRQIEA
ncbi:uncharacterized protein LOC133793926 [Humulus lupulus]|uniref:uncharacterized protein LOC133793926 n=1 Tax=Humulus lupulus TaxID=3486 RepID=UPI002B416348|nr:uncharacterized protein LOC133793926 [Humulus lupulus]